MRFKSHLVYWIQNDKGGLMFVELAGSENASSD
eukprot:CAMPEP_0168315930 /NCGR_PEP_ID=MMETSP0210-20121227/13310_1 /TAXON_ID=40633 /ORGANISM="Condylostoma magnum, Strain COL2" /LENGTH=32 /DNA_ID= /DNA_START= /DNA_END= /DNA_ORIENTATION=